MDKRPELNNKISPKDFRDFYWLKEELVLFCRKEGLKKSGGKIEIANRIEKYLETGSKEIAKAKKKQTNKSNFDWNTATLTLQTKITDSYKNSENVRKFFQKEIGKQFKFNVKFMNWMKLNVGKTLNQAIKEWKRIDIEKKNNTSPKEIAPQFEYNTYLRDFLKDNPNENRKTGIKLWKIKRSLRGDNVYCKTDLKLLK